MSTIAWGRCSTIYENLSLEERACLKKLRAENATDCPEPLLLEFEALGILTLVDGVRVLTDEGRLLALFC
ncbi:MAG: hypothetical protein JWN94_2541 [Betaproteobacteria bacterium]|nr:hypothetical protein [Betaproteobacteria bacterium]